MRGSCTGGESEQLVEAEAAVAAPARIRRLAACVPLDERLDDGAPELLAEIERHVREPERVTGLAGRDHGLGRAAGALGVGSRPGRATSRSVTPIAFGPARRSATALSTPPLMATAMRSRVGLRAEDLRERVCECIRRECLARHGRRLQQRHPGESVGEAGCVGVHDPVAVDREAHKGELFAARRIADDFEHAASVASAKVE